MNQESPKGVKKGQNMKIFQAEFYEVFISVSDPM